MKNYFKSLSDKAKDKVKSEVKKKVDVPFEAKKKEPVKPRSEIVWLTIAGATYHQKEIKEFIKDYAEFASLNEYDGLKGKALKEELEHHLRIWKHDTIILSSEQIKLVKEPFNKHDKNAIKIEVSLNGKRYHIGYVARDQQELVKRANPNRFTLTIYGGAYKELEENKVVTINDEYNARMYFHK